ncbi:MAG TPA: FAD-binding oxidoreductase [Thermoanaerobaculia bacterium]|nr:FAD-binding oxidoreductase [Thermoanaerobaculia bacterium]
MAEPAGDALVSWGLQRAPGRERRSEDLAAVARELPLTRGLGRAYGDAALPPRDALEVAGSVLADRILDCDSQSGSLRAEAGLSLRHLNRVFLRRGWSIPVSPGTEHVTLGGMVAADVHGKNHHRAGTLGGHVTGLRLLTAGGEDVACSPTVEPELFWATVGGMGLTGHILEVELPLAPIPSPWLVCESWRVPKLGELVRELRRMGEQWPFTAAWVEGLGGRSRLGRGMLLCGRWAEPGEAPARPPRERRAIDVPFDAPRWLLNRLSVGAFNLATYHRHQPRHRRTLATPDSFFYPLDAVGSWNRLYGRRGFTQYQCVLPAEAGVEVVEDFVDHLRSAGGYPFLAVLKDLGEEGRGMLSFPRAGFTLALDFPVERGTPGLVAALNDFVIACGGRIYLAKDAFTTREDLRAMDGERLEAWQQVRSRWDPYRRLRSRLSERLLDP